MMRKKISITCVALMLMIGMWAQTPIYLSSHDSIKVEKFRLLPDSTDYDVTLTFSFHELPNRVTVQMESSHLLFCFLKNTYYGQVFTRGHLFRRGRRLKPQSLPYLVQFDLDSKFRMKRRTKRSLGENYRKYIFRPWVVADEVEAIQNPQNELLCDKWLQTFELESGQDELNLSILDLLVLKHSGAKRKAWNRYKFTYHKNVDKQYRVFLLRDSCFYAQDELAKAKEELMNVRIEFAKMQARFPEIEPVAHKVQEHFLETKDELIRRFPRKESNSICPDVRRVWDSYNMCVDSIISAKRELKLQVLRPERADGFMRTDKPLDVNVVLFKSRQLDELTGLWQLTSSQTERLNIRQQCERIVNESEKYVQNRSVTNDEQREALKLLQMAIDYYKKTLNVKPK